MRRASPGQQSHAAGCSRSAKEEQWFTNGAAKCGVNAQLMLTAPEHADASWRAWPEWRP